MKTTGKGTALGENLRFLQGEHGCWVSRVRAKGDEGVGEIQGRNLTSVRDRVSSRNEEEGRDRF